jgi:hypothetical protein
MFVYYRKSDRSSHDGSEKLLEVLKLDGVVAIATLGQDGYMVNTWNSYTNNR